jgi:hypothetical protein
MFEGTETSPTHANDLKLSETLENFLWRNAYTVFKLNNSNSVAKL